MKQLDLPTERLKGNLKGIYLNPPARKQIHDLADRQSCLELDPGCQLCSQVQQYKEEWETNLGSLCFGWIETEEDRASILRMMKSDDEKNLSSGREKASFAPPVHLISFRT